MARAPHELYGHVPGREAYSAARFAARTREQRSSAPRGGRVPIVVGGTGLYFNVLLEGLSPVPPIPEAVRATGATRRNGWVRGGLHAILAEPRSRDGRAPRADRSAAHRARARGARGDRSLALGLARGAGPSRARGGKHAALRRGAVTARAQPALRRALRGHDRGRRDRGGEALARLELDPELPIMRALGVRPLTTTHRRRDRRARRRSSGARPRRVQYAKRQMTWIRSNMSAWNA